MIGKEKNSNKIYLKNLAKEHELHLDTYVSIMEQYEYYLFKNYNITIKNLKRTPLMPWQVDLMRRLNPTDFQISTMKEMQEYNEWHEWLSNVLKFCAGKS